MNRDDRLAVADKLSGLARDLADVKRKLTDVRTAASGHNVDVADDLRAAEELVDWSEDTLLDAAADLRIETEEGAR